MTGHEIRTKFLEFFASKGHKICASDSLVPKDDPTVLFTSAGMQQFKPQFMGHLTGFARATTSQKCLRTDDLTEVGVTDFHHTMFEMLGNFSFGDYFKREAISWAWEFLTKVLGIPADKLWVSVHKDDEEAYGIWLTEIKVPKDRIVKLGDKSNFWPSNARLNGPNGPCGPCSEIFYDWGKADCQNPQCDPDCSCGRFCEVWNLVFTQYNRKDGGALEPLPAKNIDTGMGLERLTAVMQGKHNNFDSDLFQPIIKVVERAVAAEGAKIALRETRVIADHVRAVTFGISDGVIPSNEGRGYVMRRLIVDMVNILIQAGVKKPLVHGLVPVVVDVMKGPYPELVGKQAEIAETVLRIEEAVIRLNAQKLPELLAELKKGMPSEEVGEIMFRYRDTHGLSYDQVSSAVTKICGAGALPKAKDIYEALLEEQKTRSRQASKMQGDVFLSGDVDVKGIARTAFVGYDQPSLEACVIALFVDGQKVAEAREGQRAVVVLDKTPFYPEQGGQIADTGLLRGKAGSLDVQGVRKVNDVILHQGPVSGVLKAGEFVKAAIDGERRMAIMRNHTATHLLQAALRQVLGPHVKQQGSSVDENRLRFDFTHPKAVTREEVRAAGDIVNALVRRAVPVSKKEMPIEEAKQSGALSFFAEKYGETVRVVSVAEASSEFCGGTHLDNTGQIGLFRILSEGAVAQGVRRIEAVTGTGAVALVRSREEVLERAAQSLKVAPEEVADRIDMQSRRIKDLQKELGQVRFDAMRSGLPAIVDAAEEISGAKFVAHLFEGADMEMLRKISDAIRQKCPRVLLVLGGTGEGSSAVIVAASDDLVKGGVNCGTVIKTAAPLFGGSGGGRPNMAQAGGQDPARLVTMFRDVSRVVREAIER
ncbi:MAG: alanine--tRNA ligase [Elusimicrobia bacterium]|nr:alanine--tRNA ligase [Elusimicrobiota bacterium]